VGYGESPSDLDDWKKASESILSPGVPKKKISVQEKEAARQWEYLDTTT
jgi:hypothetical protein